MSVGALIVARLSSSRLPRKALLDVWGKPMVERLAERVLAAKTLDKVVLATSTDPSDDELEAAARRMGILCHRGSLESVNERVAGAARAHGCDSVVELLGDNPLIHSDLVDDVVRFYLDGGFDYAASVTAEYPVSDKEYKLFSVGLRVQVYSRAAAERYEDYPGYADVPGRGTTSYIFEHPDAFKVGYFEAKGRWGFMNRPGINFAVNYAKNLEFARAVFQRQYTADKNFSLERVYRQYDEEARLRGLLGA